MKQTANNATAKVIRYALLLILLLSIDEGDGTALAAEALPSGVQPNVVIIFCDNLGYGDIGPFGARLQLTPHLNRMASEGRKFTHFYATAGVCTPSRASLMTGCYAQRVGMDTNPRDGQVLRPVSPFGLASAEITIAEVAKSAGYATAIVGKWHLGDQPQFLPTRQGFDEFFGIPYSDDMTEATGRRLGDRLDGNQWPPLPLMEGTRVIEAPVDRHQLTQRYTRRALRFIREHQDSPFLLYLAHAMPGSTKSPFASEQFRGKSRNGPWGDAVEELDWSTGQILDILRELNLDERTLVIWTSDNGAPLAADKTQPTRGSNSPLHGRGYTTGEGAFRVPMLAWWPGTVPDNTSCETLTTTLDLLPTIASLAGVKPPEDRTIDGHDITRLLVGDAATFTPYDAFFYYQEDQLQAVRSGKWKLFLPLSSFERHPHFRNKPSTKPLLFDLLADVGCEHDIAPDHPDIVRRLQTKADEARRELGDRAIAGNGTRPRGEVSDPTPRTMQSR